MPAEQGLKKRAACDECRVKKLKCTGERPICSRCQREHIECIYSTQKQMGRPRKRRKSMDTTDEVAQYADQLPGETSNQLAMHSMHEDHDSVPELSSIQSPSIALWGDPVMTAYPTSAWFDAPHNHRQGAHATGLNIPPELTRPYQPSVSTLNTPSLVEEESITSEPVSQTSLSPPCACLSTMYLTLNELSIMDTDAEFPAPLHALRAATTAAAEILACTECPKKYFTGMQNTSAVSSLLMGIVERYSKVLSNITAESGRAEAAGESKRFRLADLESPTTHLHSGGLGAVASFTITLTPSEWRSMCKKVVRAEVYGPSAGNDCCPYLAGVMDQMEHRQKHWHAINHAGDDLPGAVPASMGGRMCQSDPVVHAQGENPLCLKMLGFSRHMLDQCDWS